jgi:hypothetical protein
LLRAVLFELLVLGLELADLAGKFVHDLVDGGVKIGFRVFGMEVGARKGEVDLHMEGFFAIVVVEKNNVGAEDRLAMALEVADLFGNEFMNGTGKSQVSRSDVDLHDSFLLKRRRFVDSKNPLRKLRSGRADPEKI